MFKLTCNDQAESTNVRLLTDDQDKAKNIRDFMSVLISVVKLVMLKNILQFAQFPTCEYIG